MKYVPCVPVAVVTGPGCSSISAPWRTLPELSVTLPTRAPFGPCAAAFCEDATAAHRAKIKSRRIEYFISILLNDQSRIRELIRASIPGRAGARERQRPRVCWESMRAFSFRDERVG